MNAHISSVYHIFVPNAECGIDVGSGIVGTYDDDGVHVEVDFEGNRFKAANLERWIERVAHAAGRRAERYPTVARRQLPASLLVEVGIFDIDAGIAYVDDVERVRTWCGEETISSVVVTEDTARRNAIRAALIAQGFCGSALEREAARYGA